MNNKSKKLISILIMSITILLLYAFLNMYFRNNTTFENLKLNNIDFELYENYKEGELDKYIYKSKAGLKIVIYKTPAYIAVKGKPFSVKINDKYNKLNDKNKKVRVLSDYYHHIFIMEDKNEVADFEKYFSDYETTIYCKLNKNPEFHQKYSVLYSEKYFFDKICKKN